MPGLVGREPELDRLTGWVDDVANGLGRAALLEGEQGIGKSALLQAARDDALTAGCSVFSGAGEELGQAFPLLPLLQAFAHQSVVADPSVAAEALLDLIDRRCAQSPVLLVVDDLHWADEATVAVCHRLARSVAQRPLLLIGATRPMPRRADLKALRRGIHRDGLIRLCPLGAAAVTRLVADLSGGQPGPQLVRLAADAAGNPLYLTELVGALDRAGSLQVSGGAAELAGGPVPATLSEAIGDRLGFLDQQVREMLRAAALLGSEFTVDDLVVVTGRRPADLAPALADARAAGVLAEAGLRLAFRHPLIRTALYEDLTDALRLAWHRDAARALHDAGASIDRVARQLLPALPALDDWVVDWLVDQAPMLLGQATPVAVDLLAAATGHTQHGDPRRAVLTSHLAEGLVRLNRPDEAAELAERILPEASDPEIFTTLALTLATCRATTGQYDTALHELAVAVTRPGLSPRHRALLRVKTAWQQAGYRREVEAAEQAAHDALSWIDGSDAEIESMAMFALGVGRAWEGDELGALEKFDRALAAAAGNPDLADLQLLIQLNVGLQLVILDRTERGERTLREAQRLADRMGNHRRLAQVQTSLAFLFFHTGKWDDALAETALASLVPEPYNRCQADAAAALIFLHRGDAAAARRHLAAAEENAANLPDLVIGMLDLARALDRERSGTPADALALLRVDGEVQEIELVLPDGVRLALAAKDNAAAAELTARAEALPSQDEIVHRAGIASHCRGLRDADPVGLQRAAEQYASAHRPLLRAQALEAAAALLAEGGEIAAARPSFNAAMDLYVGLGAAWEVTRMRARFRPHGIRLPTRRIKRPATGWEALTASEAKVAALVAEGLSNPEIAEQLVVSRRTVETHITKVLAKLHARSRVDLARAAVIRAREAGAVAGAPRGQV